MWVCSFRAGLFVGVLVMVVLELGWRVCLGCANCWLDSVVSAGCWWFVICIWCLLVSCWWLFDWCVWIWCWLCLVLVVYDLFGFGFRFGAGGYLFALFLFGMWVAIFLAVLWVNVVFLSDGCF